VILTEREGLRLLVFPHLESAGLACAVSTRPLDARDARGRSRLVAAVGLDPARAVSPRQVHHADVVRVEPDTPADPAPTADALVTDAPGKPLVLRAADCSLVVVADPDHRAVGVAHAGWKGSARGVVVQLVRALEREYGTDPARCLAGIAPTIRAPRYPVGAEVVSTFVRTRSWTRGFVLALGGRFHLDLPGINARFLEECGVPRESIVVSERCTYECADLLHSWRRDGVEAGHHGLVAAWPVREGVRGVTTPRG